MNKKELVDILNEFDDQDEIFVGSSTCSSSGLLIYSGDEMISLGIEDKNPCAYCANSSAKKVGCTGCMPYYELLIPARDFYSTEQLEAVYEVANAVFGCPCCESRNTYKISEDEPKWECGECGITFETAEGKL